MSVGPVALENKIERLEARLAKVEQERDQWKTLASIGQAIVRAVRNNPPSELAGFLVSEWDQAIDKLDQ